MSLTDSIDAVLNHQHMGPVLALAFSGRLICCDHCANSCSFCCRDVDVSCLSSSLASFTEQVLILKEFMRPRSCDLLKGNGKGRSSVKGEADPREGPARQAELFGRWKAPIRPLSGGNCFIFMSFLGAKICLGSKSRPTVAK